MSTDKRHGEPAFSSNVSEQYMGLSVRDYFAAKAMQALVSRGAVSNGAYAIAAIDSYDMADAMLKAGGHTDE